MKYITNVSKISNARAVMDMHHYYSGLRTLGMRGMTIISDGPIYSIPVFRKRGRKIVEPTSRFARFVCFQVRYAPKVSLSKIDRIVEGSELKFRCFAEANPPDVEYR